MTPSKRICKVYPFSVILGGVLHGLKSNLPLDYIGPFINLHVRDDREITGLSGEFDVRLVIHSAYTSRKLGSIHASTLLSCPRMNTNSRISLITKPTVDLHLDTNCLPVRTQGARSTLE
ncbi:hypothetical protein AcW1_008254 [Taiwanofungus camphoratus]|nr:hypothetical protein AcW1_008254 [Antrodia cinnamomea]KAI0956028.1 hypothetical protein AcV7_006539 [Antrodia cinnamomea]